MERKPDGKQQSRERPADEEKQRGQPPAPHLAPEGRKAHRKPRKQTENRLMKIEPI